MKSGNQILTNEFVFVLQLICMGVSCKLVAMYQINALSSDETSILGRIFSKAHCGPTIFIIPAEFTSTSKVINLYKEIYAESSILIMTYHEREMLHHGSSPEKIKHSVECILLIFYSNATFDNVTSILNLKKIYWDYETRLFVVCNRNHVENFALSHPRNSNLFNALIMDATLAFSIHICNSRSRTQRFNLTDRDLMESFNFHCKLDLEGRSVSILYRHNPPMTEFNDPEKRKYATGVDVVKNLEEVNGLEKQFLKSIQKRFNFRADIRNPRDINEYVRDGEKIVVRQNDLRSGQVKIDGTLQTVAVFISNTNIMHTLPLYYEASCILVDRSMLPSYILNPYDIFRPNVYAVILITSLSVTFCWLIIAKVFLQQNDYGPFIMMTFYMINNGGIYRSLHLHSEKILVIFFLIFNLVILNVFQGNLVNIFNRLDQFHSSDQFGDFINLNIPVMPFCPGIGQYFQMYIPAEEPVYKKFAMRITAALKLSGEEEKNFLVTDYENYTKNGFAVLTTLSLAKKRITDIVKRNFETTSLIIIPVKIDKAPMVCFVNEEFNILNALNKHVLKLLESNLLMRWYKDSVDDHLMKIHKKLFTNKSTHTLTVKELEICFLIFVVGMVASSLAFMVEIITHHYQLNRCINIL